MSRHPRHRKDVILALEYAWERFEGLSLCALVQSVAGCEMVSDAELVARLDAKVQRERERNAAVVERIR